MLSVTSDYTPILVAEMLGWWMMWSAILAKGLTNVDAESTPKIRLGTATVCSRSPLRMFVVPPAKPCARPVPKQKKSCAVQVFNPSLGHIPVTAHVCFVKERRFTTHKYFWGEEVSTKGGMHVRSVSVGECTALAKDKQLPGVGVLKPDGSRSWRTRNGSSNV